MKYTPRRLWTIKDLKLLGSDTDAAIAERIGRSRTVVTAMRSALGIRPYKPVRFLDPAVLKLLGTAGDRVIAEQVGCGLAFVRALRLGLGIPPYRKHPPRTGDAGRVAKMRKLRTAGWTCQAIAAEFGLTRQRVHQILMGRGKQDIE